MHQTVRETVLDFIEDSINGRRKTDLSYRQKRKVKFKSEKKRFLPDITMCNDNSLNTSHSSLNTNLKNKMLDYGDENFSLPAIDVHLCKD